MFLETKRLYLRKMSMEDFDDVEAMLNDIDIMYAYEHEFSEDDVRDWINDNLKRYTEKGLGLMAIILKDTDDFIGQAGLTYTKLDDSYIFDITYLLKKKFWRRGYAIEIARALANYAFDYLETDKVYARIRFDNYASQKVARNLGMKPIKSYNVLYYGNNIPHDLYVIDKETFDKNNNI